MEAADPIKKKTVCLAMIVKNEGHLIIETLNHLAKYIKFDYWVINDNGSTDGTQDLIRNYFKEKKIPGELDETPWRDFAFNRTIVFQVAYKKADYVFVWDADDEISGDFKFPSDLTGDSYKFVFGNESGLRYCRCQLFNNHLKWNYVGVLHEYPACLENSGPSIDVTGNYYFISGRRGDRSKDPNKYLKDALILEKAFNEAYEKKEGIYNRYAFYTAQSYNSCGQHEKAIEFYKKVLTLDNWYQEKYFSCLEIYDQYEKLQKEEEGLRFLVESFRYDRTRLECIYRLVKYYCIKGLPEISLAYYSLIQGYYENQYLQDEQNVSNHLFAKKEEYDFYLPYYMIIVSERNKRFDIFNKMLEIIFKRSYLYSGPWWIHNLFFNIQFGIPTLSKTLEFLESMFKYVDALRQSGVSLTNENYVNLDKIIQFYRPLLVAPSDRKIETKQLYTLKRVRVMLTVTTCKRYDLFQQTINSLKRFWKDLDQVDYFFCVDDNSSAEDRMLMQKHYPFFHYYMKSADEKGHRESMNIVWNKLKEIKPDYWIHMEDDWVYFKSENYVSRGIQLLENYEKDNIHQLVFNRTYGLMMDDMKRVGGRTLEPGVWLHEQKEVQGPNCAYWPHYSLQPSVTRTSVILELGNYDSLNTFFERDYANKYGAAGYQTMFFDGIYSLHIGKQHWEKDGKNAYALNEVGQFKPPDSASEALVIREKQVNSPLKATMREDLEEILCKIQSGTYFGLIRPSDGEHTILKGSSLTNCDGWTFTKGSVLESQLMTAIQTVDPNLYIGIPCNSCNKPWNCTDEIYNNFIETWKVPLGQRTYANLVGNSNWKRFSEFMMSYKKGFFYITSGTAASPLPIKERFIIDSKLVNQWDTLGIKETQRLKNFLDGKYNQLICFSAGPLSKIWIPMFMKLYPNNMYLDVGGSLDLFTKGASNRFYTNQGHPFASDICIFKDIQSVTNGPLVTSVPLVLEDMPSEIVRINKNLVYFCVFHNKNYMELLKILLMSLKFYSSIESFSLLAFTSADFLPLIESLSESLNLKINVKIFDFSSMQQATCARLHIFDYEDIGSYEKILYIDTDIIVQNDLSKIFDIPIEDKIYALDEGTIEHEYHGGWYFDFKTIDKNTPGMNSGILLFQNSERIKTVFKNIQSHIASLNAKGTAMPACQDQPFINYHTIKDGYQDTVLLKQYALIYCIDPPPPPSGPTDIILCHFVWPIGNAQHKKQRMINHINHIIKNHTALTKHIAPYTPPDIIGKTFTWGSHGKIQFHADKLLTTWAIGTYTWLDVRTVDASWSGYSHILQFHSNYTAFICIRRGDLEYGNGDLLVSG